MTKTLTFNDLRLTFRHKAALHTHSWALRHGSVGACVQSARELASIRAQEERQQQREIERKQRERDEARRFVAACEVQATRIARERDREAREAHVEWLELLPTGHHSFIFQVRDDKTYYYGYSRSRHRSIRNNGRKPKHLRRFWNRTKLPNSDVWL